MWLIPDGLILADDHTVAAWAQQRLLPLERGTGYRVANLVPQGFEAFARIFHPASRYFSDRREREPVRWSDIASWTGRVAHSAMQFHTILGHPESPNIKPEWGSLPKEGSLGTDLASSITDILAAFTTTPKQCYFCIWEGRGGLFGDDGSFAYLGAAGGSSGPQHSRNRETRERIKTARPIEIGSFTYLVFVGRLDAILHGREMPSIRWPQDRAWYLATDIDMTSTIVGGSADCISQLVADPRLEAMPISVDTRIDVDGDTLNA